MEVEVEMRGGTAEDAAEEGGVQESVAWKIRAKAL